MAQGDPRKWHMPGWRIEQKFSPGVLIGNWDEDRYRFQKLNLKHNSTHRVDFKNCGSHRPDVVVRRKALLRSDGLPAENLFWHHGNRYTNNMLSWYDEHYNGRWRENTLPPSRQWNGHQLAWGPEKSDFPLQAAPTNFGLLQSLQAKWQSQIADETKGDFLSTYQDSFVGHGNDAMTKTRYAVPRDQSTNLHPINKINKDLHFRGDRDGRLNFDHAFETKGDFLSIAAHRDPFEGLISLINNATTNMRNAVPRAQSTNHHPSKTTNDVRRVSALTSIPKAPFNSLTVCDV